MRAETQQIGALRCGAQGAIVANYPWDGTADRSTKYEACPDDATFKHLARTYAQSHKTMALPTNTASPAASLHWPARLCAACRLPWLRALVLCRRSSPTMAPPTERPGTRSGGACRWVAELDSDHSGSGSGALPAPAAEVCCCPSSCRVQSASCLACRTTTTLSQTALR